MRILAVILGTFLALFGLAFGGCAVAWITVVFQNGMPDMAVAWLMILNAGLAAGLLRAAYLLFRGPPRPPDGPTEAPGS